MMSRSLGLMMSGLLGVLFASGAEAREWNRFRGPNGSGVSTARTVPVRWTENDYNWKIKLPGVGHSSPVLWDDRLFVTAGKEATGTRMVLCLDATTGKQHWLRKFTAASHRKHKLNSFASATPAVDDRHLVVCWGTPEEFIVTALDHQGRDVWRVDLGPFKSGHGDGVSPIVHNDLVIVPLEHGGQSALVALDRMTGKQRWKVLRESSAHYSTPCVLHRKGRPAELIFTNWRNGITALKASTGKISWEADVFDKGHVECSIGSPIVAGDLVLGLCGYLGYGNEIIAVRPDRSGPQSKATQIYRINRSAPLCTTPVIKGHLLFIWSDQGVVTCANVASGEVYWRKRAGGNYYASPICVGDHVYNISTDGEVVVLKAAETYEVAARNELGEASHATPAVENGVMYLRTFSQLMSLGGKR